MHFPKLSSVVDIYHALRKGKQVHIVITIKKPPKPAPTMQPCQYSPRHHYQIETCVKTSRKGTTRWAPIPMEVPAGTYSVTLCRK